ncbi:MAG: hypothetical protein ACK45R_10330 [Candidatus Kapaibacterium sp.]
MLARITSALTLFSMILVMLGSALHTHGSAHVYGAGHGDRYTNVHGATAVDAQCAGVSVSLDAPSRAAAHDGSDCSLCKVTKERVVACAAAPVVLLLARPAPQAEHVVHEVCVRVIVRAAGRAPPIC